MPVGRIEFMHLGPVRFEDYLLARKDEYLLGRIRGLDPGDSSTHLGDSLHAEALDRVAEFLFCGGMPEASARFAQDQNAAAVMEIHTRILDTYRADIVKYASRAEVPKVHLAFDYALHCSHQKVKYSRISPDYPSRDLKEALQLLCLAKIATPIIHSTCAGIPLEATQDLKRFKLCFLDVGLMNSTAPLALGVIRSLKGDALLTRGTMAEQFVGQHLLYRGLPYREPRLHYWLREGKSANAEVDFTISVNDTIVPIEVKAGATGWLKSLHLFNQAVAYKKKRLIRLSTRAPSQEASILSLPLYMVQQVERLVEMEPAS